MQIKMNEREIQKVLDDYILSQNIIYGEHHSYLTGGSNGVSYEIVGNMKNKKESKHVISLYSEKFEKNFYVVNGLKVSNILTDALNFDSEREAYDYWVHKVTKLRRDEMCEFLNSQGAEFYKVEDLK